MYSSQTIFLRSRGKNSSVVESFWEVLYCLSEDRRVTSQDGNTLSLTDSRYQQTMCPWGKENVPDRLVVELCKAEILFHGSSLASLLICPESFISIPFSFFFLFLFFYFSFARDFRSVFSSPHFESISSTISTERKARCTFLRNDAGVQVLLAVIPGG